MESILESLAQYGPLGLWTASLLWMNWQMRKEQKLAEKEAKEALAFHQENIAKALANAQTNIEKQRIGFQILALEKNEVLLRDIQKDKTKSIVFVSIGAVALAVVIFLAKRKK